MCTLSLLDVHAQLAPTLRRCAVEGLYYHPKLSGGEQLLATVSSREYLHNSSWWWRL